MEAPHRTRQMHDDGRGRHGMKAHCCNVDKSALLDRWDPHVRITRGRSAAGFVPLGLQIEGGVRGAAGRPRALDSVGESTIAEALDAPGSIGPMVRASKERDFWEEGA